MTILVGTATQGVADAFVEAQIATALLGQTRRAYRLDEVQLELGQPFIAAANANVEIALSRRSKAAMPNLTDFDVIRKWAWRMFNGAAASGLAEGVHLWRPPGEILIVEDPIFIELDSNATGLANVVRFQLSLTLVDISEVDRLTLLTQSLQ